MYTYSQILNALDSVIASGTKRGAIPEHASFYFRGILNSVNPAMVDGNTRLITEDDVSGEYLEMMRLVANYYASDLQEGQVREIGYADVRRALGEKQNYYSSFEVDSMADIINTSLGKFRIKMVDGERIVDYDKYDFPDELAGRIYEEEGREATAMDYINEAIEISNNDKLYETHNEKMHRIGHLIGEVMMPQDDPDTLKVRIVIPNEPQLVDIDFDDEPEPEATDFVMEGPMTNKRKQIWDKFTNIFVGEAQAAESSMVLPISKPQTQKQMVMPKSREQMQTDVQNKQLAMSIDAESA
jgi:tetratricopeptide (TPR) repeat protein